MNLSRYVHLNFVPTNCKILDFVVVLFEIINKINNENFTKSFTGNTNTN